MFSCQIYRRAPVNWSYDCYYLEFYLHITFNNFALEIIQSSSHFVVSINFLSGSMASNALFKVFFYYKLVIRDFSLNCLGHIMDFHFLPSKVKFIKKWIFHKHFANSPREFFYLHLIKVTIWSNVSNHRKTFLNLRLYFNTKNWGPSPWFFFLQLNDWYHNTFLLDWLM